jgi:hypothetical protein
MPLPTHVRRVAAPALVSTSRVSAIGLQSISKCFPWPFGSSQGPGSGRANVATATRTTNPTHRATTARIITTTMALWRLLIETEYGRPTRPELPLAGQLYRPVPACPSTLWGPSRSAILQKGALQGRFLHVGLVELVLNQAPMRSSRSGVPDRGDSAVENASWLQERPSPVLAFLTAAMAR